MAGTNVALAKRALIDIIRASGSADLTGVQVEYSWPGASAERECVHLGRATWDTEQLAMRGGGRMPRKEQLNVDLFVIVVLPGGTVQEAEDRATQIGGAIEDIIAADTTLSQPSSTGLLLAGISGGEIDHDTTDDEAIAAIQYRVAFLSKLT